MKPRIIAGTAKNVALEVAEVSRPVTDRIKQSIFDLIQEFIEGAEVLDLFAGSGSFGLESLSRGAKFATFVDSSWDAVELLKHNIARTGFEEQTQIRTQPVEMFIHKTESKFDLIFVDPPFVEAEQFPLNILLRIVKPESIIVIRYPSEAEPHLIKSFDVVHEQSYGASKVLFLRLNPNTVNRANMLE